MKTAPISVYVANLLRRTDRRESVEAQFAGRNEFELTIVPAVERENGAWGVWQTFYGIVERENKRQSNYFIFCEDDHVFTEYYSAEVLRTCIDEASALGADILSGGMSWLRQPVQVLPHLFKVEAFNGMQFTVVFRRFYATILSYKTEKGFVLDKHLSGLSDRIFVIFPFVSVQRDFGYSDATTRNNARGRVPMLFDNVSRWLQRLSNVYDFYKRNVEHVLQTRCGEFSDAILPTSIIHLPERKKRLESITEEFSGRSEFDVHVMGARRHKKGAVGLWQSMCAIVRQAEENNEELVLICEDDHVFTSHYEKKRFLQQVWTAGMLGTDILIGGVGGFGDMVPVCNGLYWVDWFWCTQFIVVFRRAYFKILEAVFEEGDTADEFLSHLLPNKLAIVPFISVQKEFGYSDVTASNNKVGKITNHFERCREKASSYMRIDAEYNIAPTTLTDERAALISKYLTTASPRALQLGCGKNLLKGWLNTDILPAEGAIALDAAHPFPFPNDSFDYVFSEHMLEHLDYEQGKRMLQECHRILKSGGVLRITMPTLDFLQHLMTDHSTPVHQKYAQWSLKQYAPRQYRDVVESGASEIPMSLVVNNFMRMWGHRMIYDFSLLRMLLAQCGFTAVEEQRSGSSPHPFLCGLECHQNVIPAWANELESFTVEAVKK